jgi:hypothetical protein
MGQRDGSAAVENFFFVVMCTSIGTLVMGCAGGGFTRLVLIETPKPVDTGRRSQHYASHP